MTNTYDESRDDIDIRVIRLVQALEDIPCIYPTAAFVDDGMFIINFKLLPDDDETQLSFAALNMLTAISDRVMELHPCDITIMTCRDDDTLAFKIEGVDVKPDILADELIAEMMILRLENEQPADTN